MDELVLTARPPCPEERTFSTHFHYRKVKLPVLHFEILEAKGKFKSYRYFTVRITSANYRSWQLQRNLTNLIELDAIVHECHFDRAQSRLPDVATFAEPRLSQLRNYLVQFGKLMTTNVIRCSLVLNWFRLDNYGRQLKPFYDRNEIPAIANGRVLRSFHDPDNVAIDPKVGDIVSILTVVVYRNDEWWLAQYKKSIVLFPISFVYVPNFGSLHGSCLSLMSDLSAAISDLSIVNREKSQLSIIDIDANTERQPKNFLWKLINKFWHGNRVGHDDLAETKRGVFGIDLTRYLSTETDQVPKVLKCCSDFIEYFGMVDGIYRKSGSQTRIRKLREIFNDNCIPNLYANNCKQEPYTIACLLKRYFRELPTPLCTFRLYVPFTNTILNFDPADKQGYRHVLLELKRIVNRLPAAHFRTLAYLCRHLRKVSLQAHKTRMSSRSLAIVWAPNLLRRKTVDNIEDAVISLFMEATIIEFFIKFPEIIFALPDDDPTDNSTEIIT